MRNSNLNIRKLVLTLSILIVLSPSIYSVNLVVANFPASYNAANGTYIPNGIVNGYDCWVHEDGGYYIYFNSTYNDWEIGPQAGNTEEYYASTLGTNNPPVGLNWNSNPNLMTQVIISVTVEDAPPAPEIDVTGNNYSIDDGSNSSAFANHTKFGSVNISSGILTRTYRIENSGTGPLTITSVVLSGDNADLFTKTDPLSSVVAIGGSTTFTVSFSPASVGIKDATVTITNDDDDEGSYDFAINGYGYTPDNLAITGITGIYAAANTVYIHQGVLNGYEYWESANNYYIYNIGTDWYIDNDLTNTDVLFSSLNNQTSPSVLDVTSWMLRDATGTPVIVPITPVSNINLTGNAAAIAINDDTPSLSNHTKFASVDIASGSRTRTYTIENTGGTALTISGITLAGVNAADFSNTNPLTSTIEAYSSTTFTVTFNPATVGTKSASVSIISNDSDENPYEFHISGDGFSPKNLFMSGITGTYSNANGTYIYQGILNEFQYWKHETLDFYIYNDLFEGRAYWNIDNDIDDASQLFYNNDSNGDNVSPVNVTSWKNMLGEGTPIVALLELPVIALISPNNGPAAGGAIVTISGVNFTTTTVVSFGSVPASGFTVISDTEIRATLPAGSGTVDVTVTSAVGVSLGLPFTYYLPVINLISPNAGPAVGGIMVNIEGNNFTGATAVWFGSMPASGFTVISDTEIRATLPAGSGTVDVTVTSATGSSLGLPFTYYFPAIVAISPVVGPAAGGTMVTISGTNFTGTTGVMFGIVPASDFTVISDTEITAISPAGSGTTDITVIVDNITSNSTMFTYSNPFIEFFKTNSSSLESVSSSDLQVDLSAISSSIITVDYKVSGTATGNGTDYTLANGTLTINAGDAGGVITITDIVDDLLDEDNETVIVTLLNPVNATLGANTVHTYTITDNDGTIPALPTVAFNAISSGGLESVSSTDLQVDLSFINSSAITVDYTVSGTAINGGIDYTLTNGILTINAGDAGGVITITDIVDDLLNEGDETIIITLSNPVNATLEANTVHTYTIIDNDETTGVADISKNRLIVYPNPCVDNIHLDNVSKNVTHIIITDLSGNTVLKTDYKRDSDINVSSLKTGSYCLTFVGVNGEKQVIKIIKE